ncbi:MAG: hypothetical protein ACLU9V_00650, partial [Roseburia sp.]
PALSRGAFFFAKNSSSSLGRSSAGSFPYLSYLRDYVIAKIPASVGFPGLFITKPRYLGSHQATSAFFLNSS